MSDVYKRQDESNDMLGTAHQSLLYFPETDECYIAYHRFYTPIGVYTDGLGYHRETCIDEVTFGEDGLMQPLSPTMEGVYRPVGEEPEPEPIQPSLFDLFDDVFPDETTEETNEEEPKETVPLCVIYDWQNGEPFEFASLKGKAAAMGKKFYAVIGNPPYQESRETTKDMPCLLYTSRCV